MKFSVIASTLFSILLVSQVSSLYAADLKETQAKAKATALVKRMTLSEKISQLHGIHDPDHYRIVPGIARLGIPAFRITNGPAGVSYGQAGPQLRATSLPAPISLAATWDPAAARKYGEIAGEETRDLGSDLLEGPDVNIARVPQGGRVFEGYGEDPYLASRIGIANIEGIQSTGIMANVKHYVANNQEADRRQINAIVGERALREIYMPAFRAAVQRADVASVMCAYPRVNGEFSCANKFLLTDVLKNEWRFDGFVISDFGAVHSTIPTALAGLDLEMPSGEYFSSKLEDAVKSGEVPASLIDDKLIRRYSKMIEFGLFDGERQKRPIPAIKDGTKARSIAEEGVVLLKNQNHILPLDPHSLHSIALIGPFAVQPQVGGRGSSHVIPLYTVEPKDAISAHLDPSGRVYTLFSLEDQLHSPKPKEADTNHTEVYALSGSDIAKAVQAATRADVAVVIVGDSDREGRDQSLTLPGRQNALIEAVAHANPRTIVVLQTGSAVLMPWLQDVPAVLETWYPGEEDGNVLADILFGDANPSGKLPLTFPRSVRDTLARNPMQYPGNGKVVEYTEGIQVGYRWYQTHHVEPLFPFGFGLSYTSFSYSDLSIAQVDPSAHRVTLHFRVKNVGRYPGAEVAQLYVGFPHIDEGDEAPRQLKGFQRVRLNPGQSKPVTITLDAQSFSYWSEKDRAWHIQPGNYSLMIGSSSADIQLRGSVQLR